MGTANRKLGAVHGSTPPQTTPRIGRVIGLSEADEVLVDFPDSGGPPRPAVSLVALSAAQVREHAAAGTPAFIHFDGGDPSRPVLVGLAQPVLADTENTREAIFDGEVVSLTGRQRVELRCGKASIILTADGKVMVRGAYISSSSSGAQCIAGASVEIN